MSPTVPIIMGQDTLTDTFLVPAQNTPTCKKCGITLPEGLPDLQCYSCTFFDWESWESSSADFNSRDPIPEPGSYLPLENISQVGPSATIQTNIIPMCSPPPSSNEIIDYTVFTPQELRQASAGRVQKTRRTFDDVDDVDDDDDDDDDDEDDLQEEPDARIYSCSRYRASFTCTRHYIAGESLATYHKTSNLKSHMAAKNWVDLCSSIDENQSEAVNMDNLCHPNLSRFMPIFSKALQGKAEPEMYKPSLQAASFSE